MSELTEKGKIIKGYKATNQDLTCQGYKFEVGEWHEHDGDVELCKSGFHFCPHMSGVWTYYPNNPKIWKVEAELVLLDNAPGADLKYVAKRIRLVKEVKIGGDGNTGDCNTGDCNTGDCNTGYRNTGDCNTGDCNTGYCNTGYFNTGDRNTGDCNCMDHSPDFLCMKERKALCFDKPTELTHKEMREQWGMLIDDLAYAMSKDEAFDYSAYSALPNWTENRCRELHQAHIQARQTAKEE